MGYGSAVNSAVKPLIPVLISSFSSLGARARLGGYKKKTKPNLSRSISYFLPKARHKTFQLSQLSMTP
jgi:hypothetical protein